VCTKRRLRFPSRPPRAADARCNRLPLSAFIARRVAGRPCCSRVRALCPRICPIGFADSKPRPPPSPRPGNDRGKRRAFRNRGRIPRRGPSSSSPLPIFSISPRYGAIRVGVIFLEHSLACAPRLSESAPRELRAARPFYNLVSLFPRARGNVTRANTRLPRGESSRRV